MLAPLTTAPARYCGCNGRDTTLTIDHVTPVSKGGRNTWINLVTACMACNQRKGDKTLQQLGWKLRSVPKVGGGRLLRGGNVWCRETTILLALNVAPKPILGVMECSSGRQASSRPVSSVG